MKPGRAGLASKPDADGAQRRGRVFTLRLEADEEKNLRDRMAASTRWPSYGRRRSLGAFIIESALEGSRQVEIPAAKPAKKKKVRR